MRCEAEGGRTAFPQRFYSLDVLRGLAALAVAISHWRHFFYTGTEPVGFNRELQPFYALLKPLYTGGGLAVDLFFCLSGFVFFWLYSESIGGRRLSLREFVVCRFSRLYPLHFLTLLFVAAGQQLFLWRCGSYFVYSHNDFKHFCLQLVFASNWGTARHDWSFNGPVWSVSVEVFLYAVFFAVCTCNLRRWWHLAILSCLGIALNTPVGDGMFSFFSGGIAFHVFAGTWRSGPSRAKLRYLAALTALMWVVIPVNRVYDALYSAYYAYIWNEHLDVHGKDVVGHVLHMVSGLSFGAVLFPLTIVTLALWEARRGTLGRRAAFLGDISYSTYLLHFPLQMTFALITLSLGVQNAFFYSPLALFLFFGTLIPLSLCSYRFMERPCQAVIRARLGGGK